VANSDSDEDDIEIPLSEELDALRKEATRKQRLEREQRRRDELNEGYFKLKGVLPVNNQKVAKVWLLDKGQLLHNVSYSTLTFRGGPVRLLQRQRTS
jgi:Helix-loop-helix DNA-binding domain